MQQEPEQLAEAYAPPAPAAPDAGPYVASPGTEFFTGANCYYLMTRAADLGTRDMVLQTLDDAKRLGVTVIRTWAFNDGDGWNALQTAPGVYDEGVFKGLDWLLTECTARQLRLMLVLTNYWPEFGGLPQYVRWSRGLPSSQQVLGEEFYVDVRARQLFRSFVTAMLSRVNTISGVPYRDDPTIFAWDICNEPRCEGDTSGNVLQEWIEEVAALVKSLDPRHRVTIGLEGFFGPSTPGLAASSNPYNQTHGVDFVRNSSSPHIDFASIHMYGDQWCSEASGDGERCAWAVGWVRAHAQACAQQLRKPLVLQEFGKKPAGPGRTELFRQIHQLAAESAAQRGPLMGVMVWMLAAASYPDYDGYTVYADGQPSQEAVSGSMQPIVPDPETPALMAQHAQLLAKYTGVAPA